MNIKEAKQEIINTVRAYTQRDETGAYEIPTERQRPILLIGPPGIGKTAIMEQVAQECGINLVAYTITHHTRQSAIGLPFITDKSYGGRPYKVTEYTMSEIIASVYDQIEQSGVQEGILFLDEINCVSETLAPTMLQFLQYKTFGRHRVPDGWVVVTAGNPPEYNRSVHEFDIATLDRLKVISAEPDYDTWKKYAAAAGVHRAIRTYLDLKPEDFYGVETTLDGKNYVTARGWEDLSDAMYLYEEKNFPVDETLIGQYICNSRISSGFASFYRLFRKYRNDYRVADIVRSWGEEGGPDAGVSKEILSRAKKAPFDERVTLMGLLTESVLPEIRREVVEENCLVALHERLTGLKSSLTGAGAEDAVRILSEDIAEMKQNIVMAEASGGISEEKKTTLQYPVHFEEICISAIREGRDYFEDIAGSSREKDFHDQCPEGTPGAFGNAGGHNGTDRDADGSHGFIRNAKNHGGKSRDNNESADCFEIVRRLYGERVKSMQADAARISREISHVLRFTDQAFGAGSEMLLAVTEFTVNSYSSEFLNRHENEEYYHYNQHFLLSEREAGIARELHG